jgi:ketosteroid isomerase-like protein
MEKLMVALALACAVVFISACQQKQSQTPATEKQPETAMNAAPAAIDSAAAAKIREELAASMMQYAQMWNAKDIKAIGEVWSHDPDVAFIPPAAHDRIVGYDAVMKYYQGNFNVMDNIDFKIRDLLIKVTPDGNSAVITYYVQNDYTDKATGKPGQKNTRVCVVKTKENGQWKMIFADSSVSTADMAKMKPAPAGAPAPKK